MSNWKEEAEAELVKLQKERSRWETDRKIMADQQKTIDAQAQTIKVLLDEKQQFTVEIRAIVDDQLRRQRDEWKEDAERLYEAARIFNNVDDHTYCHDDVPGGCVVTPLRDAISAHVDLVEERK